ncbi:MAG: alkaline phosphatase family protein [bacterium]|nr:sulfatase [Gammaproteobacteria bacterium]HIL95050.1 sulfatase [Pseudomonadales bacterium]
MQEKQEKQKNLLFITADQWRGECLSTLGHKVQTPVLDELAKTGVLFKNHFANAVPCGPSRASLHTGMYLQNHRSSTNGTPLDARHTNWALEVRKQGFDPVLFGYTDTANDPRLFDPDDAILKSYEGPLPGINPITMMGTFPDAWAAWLSEKGYAIPSPNWRLYMGKNGLEYEAGGDTAAPLDIPKEHHDTWFMVDEVMGYLDQHPRHEQGFCVHLSLLRPHPPWVAPEPYNSMYPPQTVNDYVRRDTVALESKQHPWLEHTLQQRQSAAPENQKKLARLKSSYFGLMSEVDANLGRLFDYLKEKDLWDQTMVIFTSDHGEQIGDHHLLGKMGYFDQSYHIPLIIRDPGQQADATRGKILGKFTENIDIMPTLLEWLGVDLPEQCDGMSLLSTTRTGEFPRNWRTEAHWEFDFRSIDKGEDLEQSLGLTHHQCSLNVIRSTDYKYVHFTHLPPLFFDLRNDPREFVNQANNPEYQSRVLTYAQKMLSWRMNHDEQTLTHLTLTDDGVVSRPVARY